jgi:hypothetical protein
VGEKFRQVVEIVSKDQTLKSIVISGKGKVKKKNFNLQKKKILKNIKKKKLI